MGSIAQRLAALGPSDPDARAWVGAVNAAGETVSGRRAVLVSNLIVGLKGAGIWASLDRLWLHAAENATQALIDLKARATATAVNSPTFTADRGYAGNGTTSYLNTGFTPSTAGGGFALNSASMGVYNRTNRTANSAVAALGSRSSSATETVFWPKYSDTKLYASLSKTTAGITGPSTVQGMWVLSRTSSAGVATYQNGTLFGTTSDVSSALADLPIFVCGYNSGALTQPSTDQMAATFMGGGLDAIKAAALSAALNTYMGAIGASVY